MTEETILQTTSSNRPANESLIHALFDSSEIKNNIYLDLSGMAIINNQYKKISEPKMTTEGIQMIMSILDTYLSPTTISTKYNDDQINQRMRAFSKHLSDYLGYYSDRIKLKKEERQIIQLKIEHLIEASMRRSLEGFTIDAMTENVSQTTISNPESGMERAKRRLTG